MHSVMTKKLDQQRRKLQKARDDLQKGVDDFEARTFRAAYNFKYIIISVLIVIYTVNI